MKIIRRVWLRIHIKIFLFHSISKDAIIGTEVLHLKFIENFDLMAKDSLSIFYYSMNRNLCKWIKVTSQIYIKVYVSLSIYQLSLSENLGSMRHFLQHTFQSKYLVWNGALLLCNVNAKIIMFEHATLWYGDRVAWLHRQLFLV